MLRATLERLGLNDRLPPTGDFYACPCCMRAYPRDAATDGYLTVEDVPPKALGGRPLVLTCKDCNSSSGTRFDAHAAQSAAADEFIRGTVDGRVLPATVFADGVPLRGTARRTATGIQVIAIEKQNDPRVQAAHFAALEAHARTGNPHPNVSFTVHTRFDEPKARVSWIRAAYLAAFAVLGWSYIIRPVMRPVREQLQSPDASILPTYVLRDIDAAPATRRVLLVDNPRELRSVAVVMGERTVFLPGLFEPMTCDELVAAYGSRREEGDRLIVNVSGKEAPWPRRATYLLDKPFR